MMLMIYIVLCFVVFGASGWILEDVDRLEDIMVWHVILYTVFLPTTILIALIFFVFVVFINVRDYIKTIRALKWLNKPVFKSKQKKINE